MILHFFCSVFEPRGFSVMQEFNGVIIFTLLSSRGMDESYCSSSILSFRQLTQCTGDIIFSGVHEPNLEPNLTLIALVMLG